MTWLQKELRRLFAEPRQQTLHRLRTGFEDDMNQTLVNAMCDSHGLPHPAYEVRFDPHRKWRFDMLFCNRVALEVEGVTPNGSRHQRIAGFKKDIEKYNTALIRGFKVLRCLPEDIQSGAAFALVKQALEAP